MRRLQTHGPRSQSREVVKTSSLPNRGRVEELKRRCCDDFKKLKLSIELLALEAGFIETMNFARAMWTLDRIGLKSPW